MVLVKKRVHSPCSFCHAIFNVFKNLYISTLICIVSSGYTGICLFFFGGGSILIAKGSLNNAGARLMSCSCSTCSMCNVNIKKKFPCEAVSS